MNIQEQQRTFVLVPGAWHGAWAWDGIVATLREAGHQAVAVTLDGLEPDPSPDSAGANLDTHIDRVLAVLDTCGPGPITLCAHSYAGLVVAGAADRSTRPIDRLVFCDAFVPADGDSWWNLANDHYRRRVIAGARANGRTATPSPGTDPRRRPHPLASLFQGLHLGDGIDQSRDERSSTHPRGSQHHSGNSSSGYAPTPRGKCTMCRLAMPYTTKLRTCSSTS
jgi:pimeloyl-ACP methyl ester carboxylesterase